MSWPDYNRWHQKVVSAKKLPDSLAGASCWFNYQTDILLAFGTQQVLISGREQSWSAEERRQEEEEEEWRLKNTTGM